MNKENRLAFVDSLRGFAALYVLLYHILLLNSFQPYLPYFLRSIVRNGGTGVTLFFIISAFTLCYTLKGQENSAEGVQKFYVRRIFRIVPLYYLWLLIMYTWGNLFTGFRSVFPFLFFLFSFINGKQEGVVPASWTLGVEMIFYLLFPFILQRIQKLSSAIIFLVITLIIAVAHFYISASWVGYKPYFTLFHQLPPFAMGIILYYVYQLVLEKKPAKKWGTLLLATGLTGFLCVPLFKPSLGFTHIYVICPFYCLIFLGLAIYPVKIFVNKISVFFGMISYSVYLAHPQVVNYLMDKYASVYAHTSNGPLGLLACFVFTLIPLVIIAYITYRLVEKPFTSLGKSLLKKYYPAAPKVSVG